MDDYTNMMIALVRTLAEARGIEMNVASDIVSAVMGGKLHRAQEVGVEITDDDVVRAAVAQGFAKEGEPISAADKLKARLVVFMERVKRADQDTQEV